MDKAIERMNSYGLLYHEFKSAELSEGWLSLTFNVGVCQNLAFKEEKAICKIHENRPYACKGYFCEKAKNS